MMPATAWKSLRATRQALAQARLAMRAHGALVSGRITRRLDPSMSDPLSQAFARFFWFLPEPHLLLRPDMTIAQANDA